MRHADRLRAHAATLAPHVACVTPEDALPARGYALSSGPVVFSVAGVPAKEIEEVSHDAVWRSMLKSIREPSHFFPCSDVRVRESGCVCVCV